MTDERPEISQAVVSGVWRGTYFYELPEHAGSLPPTDFEWRLGPETRDGEFRGAGDDLTGDLGRATLSGIREKRQVRIVKRYSSGVSGGTVTYIGKLSPDAQFLEGDWEIESRILGLFVVARAAGTWQAHRVDLTS